MELSVLERLVLLNLLPQEGNFTTLKLLRKLREELSFNEEEHKTLSLKQDGDQVRWNEEAKIVKDVKVEGKMLALVVEILTKLDKEDKLRGEHFTLYEKFVEVKEDKEPLN